MAGFVLAIALALVPGSRAAAVDGDPVEIHVVSHGWHTGIVVPVDDRTLAACPPLAALGSHRALEIGWGDEGFYRAESISLGTTLRAIAIPTPTVLHVVGIDRPVAERFPYADIVRLSIGAAEYEAMLASIADTFASEVPVGPGIYGESRFFTARGKYWFPNTCNVWTLRTLATAGVPVTPLLGLRAEAAMHQLARSGTVERLAPREAKWPYALATVFGLAIAGWRRRRLTRAEDGACDAHLRMAWIAAVLAMFGTLVLVVMSSNHIAWASPGSRVTIGAIVAALAGVGLVAIDRLRGGFRWREGISAALALLGVALVLSPM